MFSRYVSSFRSAAAEYCNHGPRDVHLLEFMQRWRKESLEDHMVQARNSCLIISLNLDMHISAPVRFIGGENEILL